MERKSFRKMNVIRCKKCNFKVATKKIEGIPLCDKCYKIVTPPYYLDEKQKKKFIKGELNKIIKKK